MTVSNVQTNASLDARATSGQAASQGVDRDAFMQLLVAQLQNQDPLSPLDAREFVTQLSQLSSVEELTKMNERLTQLEIVATGAASTQTISLVGKTVVARSETTSLAETGDATVSFALESPSHETKVTIRNEAGEIVREIDAGALPMGAQRVTWDGRDAAGARLPPGRYRVEVEAKSESGAKVIARLETRGTVDAVSFEKGYAELMVGGVPVLLGDLESVAN